MALCATVGRKGTGEEDDYGGGFGAWEDYTCDISSGVSFGIAAGMRCVFYFIREVDIFIAVYLLQAIAL